METKAKKLNCLSSYQGLNRFPLGQISELLLLRKESYCNLKLKCPDTGQHTVPNQVKKYGNSRGGSMTSTPWNGNSRGWGFKAKVPSFVGKDTNELRINNEKM